MPAVRWVNATGKAELAAIGSKSPAAFPDDPLNNRRWRDTLTLTDGSDARAPAFQLAGQRWPRQTFHGHLRQDVVACRRSSASPTRAWLEPELLGEVGSGQGEGSVFNGLRDL